MKNVAHNISDFQDSNCGFLDYDSI